MSTHTNTTLTVPEQGIFDFFGTMSFVTLVMMAAFIGTIFLVFQSENKPDLPAMMILGGAPMFAVFFGKISARAWVSAWKEYKEYKKRPQQ